MSQAQCSECGETFGGDYGFDRHRINMTGKPGFDPEYDWRCATPAEMEARGLHRNAKGWWRRGIVGEGRVACGGGATKP